MEDKNPPTTNTPPSDSSTNSPTDQPVTPINASSSSPEPPNPDSPDNPDLAYKSTDILKTKAYQEKNFFSRTTETLKQDRQKTILIIALAVVVFVAIVASIVALILALNPPEAEIVETTPVTTTKTETTDEESNNIDTSDAPAYYTTYVENINRIQEVFNNDPANAEAAMDLYLDYINQAISSNELDYAISYVKDAYNFFTARNLEKAALEGFIQIDISAFSLGKQCQICDMIIKLANAAGDSSVQEEYTAKLSELAARYQELYGADWRIT